MNTLFFLFFFLFFVGVNAVESSSSSSSSPFAAPPSAGLSDQELQEKWPRASPVLVSAVGISVPIPGAGETNSPSFNAFLRFMRTQRGAVGVNSSLTRSQKRMERLQNPANVDIWWHFAHQHANDFQTLPEVFHSLKPGHVILAIPSLCWHLASKASFASLFSAHRQRFGAAWGDWHPESYSMATPQQRESFLRREQQLSDAGDAPLWIVKPVRNSEAKGIRLLHEVGRGLLLPTGTPEWREQSQLLKAAPDDLKPVNSDDLVQRYIMNPLLLDGKKFTIRQEVLVVSIDPLRVYVHWNGKVKISTMPWDPASDVKGVHVTNTAYQKHLKAFDEEGHGYADASASDDVGPMRSLRWFLEEHLSPEHALKVARDMDRVTAQSVMMAKHRVLADIQDGKFLDTPFKTLGILGVDIEFLDDWQPIVIEDNCSPRLTGHRDLEWEVSFFNDIYGAIADLKGVPNHDFHKHFAAIHDELVRNPLAVALVTASTAPHANAWSALALTEYEIPMARKHGFRMIYPPVHQPELLDTFAKFLDPLTALDRLLIEYTRQVLNNRPGLLPPFPTPGFPRSSQEPEASIDSDLIV